MLKKGGILGIGEPLNNDVPELTGTSIWNFVTLEKTVDVVKKAGFTILEADYCKEANKWWNEYAMYCTGDADEKKTIEDDKGYRLSFGYVIAVKED